MIKTIILNDFCRRQRRAERSTPGSPSNFPTHPSPAGRNSDTTHAPSLSHPPPEGRAEAQHLPLGRLGRAEARTPGRPCWRVHQRWPVGTHFSLFAQARTETYSPNRAGAVRGATGQPRGHPQRRPTSHAPMPARNTNRGIRSVDAQDRRRRTRAAKRRAARRGHRRAKQASKGNGTRAQAQEPNAPMQLSLIHI
eukprot:9491238-Pyramimonas_sp.AAC.1